MIDLIIGGAGRATVASPREGLKVEWQRKGQPGRLSFEVPKQGLRIELGSPVSLMVGGSPMFAGYVFTVTESADDFVRVVVYDQLRYLMKNKDTYVYKNKTAAQLIRMLAADFNLQVGQLSDTAYIIPRRIEDNVALYDMIQNALNETLAHTKELFVFFDQAGRLSLKHLSQMYTAALVLDENTDDYSLERSIDGHSFNKIKLVRENKKKGKREVFIAQDSNNMAKWGILQYFEKINIDDQAAKQKVNALLKIHNQEERRFKLRSIAGDASVRGGSLLSVMVAGVSGRLMVDRATHTFENNLHTMDLVLQGGGFSV